MIALATLAAAATISAAQSSAIDKLVAATMSREHIAGATVAIAVNGHSALVRGYGHADVSKRTPAAADTAYWIGSITKQFTAACVLLLAEGGKLSIDDPLSRYVPGLPWGDRVTLRHLLDQESGVVDFRLGVADASVPVSRDTVVNRLKQTDLIFPPGSRYEYSNSNYYFLGLVVEKVSGMPYQQFLQSRIIRPLGLTATSYSGAVAGAVNVARGYAASPAGPQPVATENPDWSYAAGAIVSTAPDLTRWDDELRSGKLLQPEYLKEMFAPGFLDNGAATDYAFGWVVIRHNGRREIWHNGEVGGFHAMNATYPDDNTDVVVLTNTGQTFAADQLAVEIFDLLHPLTPSPKDHAATARAKEWFGRIRRGDVDRSQLTDQMSAALTSSTVVSAGAQLKAFGKLKSFELLSVDEDSSGRNYTFRLAFVRQSIRWVMGVDTKGKIASLYFHV